MTFKEREFDIFTEEERAFSSTPLGSYNKSQSIRSSIDQSGGADFLEFSAYQGFEEKAGTATINLDAVDQAAVNTKQYTISYTDSFLRIKIIKFIAEALPLLEEWANNVGTPSELKPIKNLFKLIEDYARFFDAKPSSRLLLGITQNFFIKWGKLEEKQIKHFSTLLSWFSEGEVEKEKVKSFSQQVFLINNNYIEDDKEIPEEE